MQPSLGEHERVVLPLIQLPQPRFHITADFQHLQIGPLMEQLSPAAETAGADAGIGRKLGERLRGIADEDVGNALALRHGCERESLHFRGRQVLQAVNGQINLPIQQRPLNFLSKEPLPANLPQWAGLHIPLRGDEDQLDFNAPFPQLSRHPVRLPTSQRAGAGSQTKTRRGHGARRARGKSTSLLRIVSPSGERKAATMGYAAAVSSASAATGFSNISGMSISHKSAMESTTRSGR